MCGQLSDDRVVIEIEVEVEVVPLRVGNNRSSAPVWGVLEFLICPTLYCS